VEGSALYKTKKETAHRVRAGDLGAMATLRTFACTNQRKIMMVHLNREQL
jgi:hypothetical protein